MCGAVFKKIILDERKANVFKNQEKVLFNIKLLITLIRQLIFRDTDQEVLESWNLPAFQFGLSRFLSRDHTSVSTVDKGCKAHTVHGCVTVPFLLQCLFMLVRLLPQRYFRFHCSSSTSLGKFLMGLFSWLSISMAEWKTTHSSVMMKLPGPSQTRHIFINRNSVLISKTFKCVKKEK